MKPRLAITTGDVNGIGPEIIVKTFENPEILEQCRPAIIGSVAALERYAQLGDLLARIVRVSESGLFSLPDRICILEPSGSSIPDVAPGELSADAGKFGFECVELAVRLALAGQVDAVVTCPVSKAAVNMGGYSYPGHTEFLAKLCDCADYRMMLVADNLRTVHVTTHLALREAVEQVTTARVAGTITLAHQALERLGIDNPRIAVAGLNPHAGEGTLFGREEQDEITPAIESAQADGIDVSVKRPDGVEEEGIGEPLITTELGNVVQFERYGFVRIDSVNEPKTAVVAYFTH